MDIRRKILGSLFGLFLLLQMTGCAAVIVGGAAAAATYIYKDGWLSYTYDTNLERAYRASKQALQDQGVILSHEEKGLADASFKGEYNEQTVWVDLDAESENQTVIAVRVTTLGDKEASRRIHDAIGRRL